jgi:hypothetical protein
VLGRREASAEWVGRRMREVVKRKQVEGKECEGEAAGVWGWSAAGHRLDSSDSGTSTTSSRPSPLVDAVGSGRA